MRYMLLTLLLATSSISAFTQDKILKNDNTIVEGKVLRVDSTNIEMDPVVAFCQAF